MPRVKISEYKAKSILLPLLGQKYTGIALTKDTLGKTSKLSKDKKYVVKVDEGIKKRGKGGLLYLNVGQKEISKSAQTLFEKGYSTLLVEEYVPHASADEKYLALEQTRDGILCYWANFGGIDIEENVSEIKKAILLDNQLNQISKELNLRLSDLQKVIKAFEDLYISFLEINPFIQMNQEMKVLDLAVEVDSAAEFFVNNIWSRSDIIDGQKNKEPEEFEVEKLAQGSSASFKLVVLNPKGSIFTIFSGGGASIVLADEVGNIGKGKELANYAEYSGGPSEEETYIFTKNILSLALRSPAKNKKIYIAGGVANFTDIRATFKGVIKALDEKKSELKKQGIKVYVRRGGPYQEEGLAMMSDFLGKAGLTGEVMGPDRVLTEVITTS